MIDVIWIFYFGIFFKYEKVSFFKIEFYKVNNRINYNFVIVNLLNWFK